jgi:hypothetical protein
MEAVTVKLAGALTRFGDRLIYPAWLTSESAGEVEDDGVEGVICGVIYSGDWT